MLELGTGLGVGAAWLLSGLPDSGRLLSVEADQDCAQGAWAALRTDPRARVLVGDWRDALPEGPFDLIFADPPYATGSGNAVRAAVEQAGWLAPGGWLAIETARGDRVEPGALRLDADRDTGPARLTLLQG